MVHLLPASAPAAARGATHVLVEEVVFNTRSQALIVRGPFGTVDAAGTFTADPALAPAQVVFQGEEYGPAAHPLVPPFQEVTIPLADARGWQ